MKRLMTNSCMKEVDTVATRICKVYEKTGIKNDIYLDDMITGLREKRTLLSKAIKYARSKFYLKEKVEMRNYYLRSLIYLAQGYSRHPDPTVKLAAQKIENVINRYGLSVTGESYPTKPSLFNSMLADLVQSDMQDAVLSLSGCIELIASLHAAQEELEQAQIDYEKEKSQERIDAKVTDLKEEVTNIINNQLVVYLNAMMLVDEATYSDFGHIVAEIIEDNNEAEKKRQKEPEFAE
ncbi:DUF6261 family protein [Mariniphaga sediminis]|uniref:DUF6261 family protein n=1 Tax=Mariniphaga sediminis TaxID=1628158 RepID=UPI00356867F6